MGSHVLVLRAGSRLCALPVEHVAEVLRPPLIEPMPGAPASVVGVAIVRAASVPIIDGGALLGEAPLVEPARMLFLRLEEERHAGLLVTSVQGVVRADKVALEDKPPLLEAVEGVERIGRFDGALLTVLRAARVVPPSLWQEPALDEARP